MSKHEHEHAKAGTPPATLDEIAAAARILYTAALRLGRRVTEHMPGCPGQADIGPCTCGMVDFQNAMRALGVALGELTPQNGG